ncbi:FAD-dependent monooxygenase [Streptomyces sp. R39]|uniref:FAD-dependent monooxygenase n=1 Tax=Streptomyces sp. R39 TaxID=3238631 RepID=A0AB39QLT9_9ACTN
MNGTTGTPGSPSGAAPETARVIVVGSGPTGLLLAGDLAAAGIPVTLLEKRPHKISNLSRAFVLHARALEQLDARGLADQLEAVGRPLGRLNLFNGLSLDLGTLPSRFRHVLVLPQYEVEKVLERRAAEAGVDFRNECEVTGLTQDAAGVTVHVKGAESLHAAYVVGTDGMRSVVREAVGLPFPGRSAIRSVVLADVLLAEKPEALLTAAAVGDAFAFLAPFGDGYHRVICWHRGRDVPDHEPVGLDEVREITRLALGKDYGMHDARWMSRFHSDERQVPSYRVGRVFLAGDAAHVHTPAGGQGMNTGLQDAANLSWKLAAVLHGHADPALLDTYHSERHPVGRSVLRSSGAIVRLAMAKGPMLAVRNVLIRALGHAGPVRRGIMAQVTGVGYHYPAPRGAHRLVGTRVPDLALAGVSPALAPGLSDGAPDGAAADGGRLYEALHGGRFVLVTPAPGPYGTDTAARYGDRLAVAHWRSDRRTALLVRPDGYVAWAAEDAQASGIEQALATHLG